MKDFDELRSSFLRAWDELDQLVIDKTISTRYLYAFERKVDTEHKLSQTVLARNSIYSSPEIFVKFH